MELPFIKMGKTKEKHITGERSRVWFGAHRLKGKVYVRHLEEVVAHSLDHEWP